MKIALDAMGGDFAPKEIVRGAIEFGLAHPNDCVLLVGDQERIDREIEEFRIEKGFAADSTGWRVIHAEDNIEMNEHPASAVKKKKNCSLRVANRLVRNGEAEGILSMGNTGACVASSLFELGRLPGVKRPTVGAIFPTTTRGGVVVLDVGANIDCAPLELLQFARMGSLYSELVLNRKDPRVALLNIGSEEIKGTRVMIETHSLFKTSDQIHFIGNTEGDDIFKSQADVIVCDGFIGNIVLKTCEGLSSTMKEILGGCLKTLKVDPDLQKKLFFGMAEFSADNPRYSCAPLLGLDGVSLIAHGNCKARKVQDALGQVQIICESGLMSKMRASFQEPG